MPHQIIGLEKRDKRYSLSVDTSFGPVRYNSAASFPLPPPLLSSYLDPSITAAFCSLSSCGASGLCHSTYL